MLNRKFQYWSIKGSTVAELPKTFYDFFICDPRIPTKATCEPCGNMMRSRESAPRRDEAQWKQQRMRRVNDGADQPAD